MDDLHRSDPDRDDAADRLLARDTYDWSDISPVVAVVETVSSVSEGPSADPGLVHESVDGDAIDALVRATHDSRVTVSFPYGDYVVSLTSDGDCSVYAA